MLYTPICKKQKSFILSCPGKRLAGEPPTHLSLAGSLRNTRIKYLFLKAGTRRRKSTDAFFLWYYIYIQYILNILVPLSPTCPLSASCPQVREVSNRILSTANSQVESDPLYTHLVTIFGQWTDHDLTFTPHSPVIRSFSNGIDCDKSCERTEPCFPIDVSVITYTRKKDMNASKV